MRSLLVTGGAGFIGANFVHYWCERFPQDRLVVVDALTYAGCAASLHELTSTGRIILMEHDICDTSHITEVLHAHAVDHLVHFAAESHVDRSISGPQAFVRTNIEGTHSLLMAAREAWKGREQGVRFHHVSTDEVYGSLGPDDEPFSETTPYAPRSPYAASKAAADHLVASYHHTYGLPTVITHCSNNYGPFQFPEKLIPLLITRALHGQPLPIYGDGLNIRDWLYVGEHCRGLELALSHGEAGASYNLGGRCELRNLEVVARLCALLDEVFAADPSLRDRYPAAPGRDFAQLVTHVPDRLGHDRRYAVCHDKATAHLGYEPEVGFEEGLRRTLRWYLEHESWWRPLLPLASLGPTT